MYPQKIYIQECCPRDGWQKFPPVIPTETKLYLIRHMLGCGVRQMDLARFAPAGRIPQMADAADVFRAIAPEAEAMGVQITAVATDAESIALARQTGAKNLQFSLSASQEHSLRNARCTVEEAMRAVTHLAADAADMNITLCISCGLGSPYGDEISVERLKWIIREANAAGITSFGLGDTAGISTPRNTRKVLGILGELTDLSALSLHLHDAYGFGIANACAAMEMGVTHFDTSLAGMGGCPFLSGAKGNLSTEDFVNLCDRMDIETGLSLPDLMDTAQEMCAKIDAENRSCIHR